MASNHIFIETRYEYKRSRRNVIFWMFVILGIVGITLHVFTPLSGLGSGKSLEQLSRGPMMEWVSRALPSSIPFQCAYLFNILQLFFVSALVINDTRLSRFDSTVALSVHPQGNAEITTGNVAGKLLAFTLVNVSLLAFCALLNLLFYPEVFNAGYYAFYWLTLNLPTLVFCVGLSTLVARLARNQGLSVILVAILLGVLTLPCSVWFNGLLDPLATATPNLFSDFTGHVTPGNYWLQRSFILFTGVGLAILSVIPYPRVHNDPRAASRLARLALLPLLLAGGLAVVYTHGFQSATQKRAAFRDAYARHAGEKVLKVTGNHLRLKETRDGISVTSEMTVENRDSVVLPVVLYLNPGLVVSSITVDGETVSFERDQQVLLVDGAVSPGETRGVVVNYEGKIDNRLCFLDTPEEKYASPGVNTIGMYRFGYSPAFCERGYKLLTPECGWYPVSVPPYHPLGYREKMFTRYALEVEHDPGLVAICQGKADRETAGKTTFRFDHNMPGISLCIGDYKRREILVRIDTIGMYVDKYKMPEFVEDDHPVRVELFYSPAHEFMLDLYDRLPKRELLVAIGEHTTSVGFHGGGNYWEKRLENKTAHDPTLQYPYGWLSLVEVPCDFHVFPGRLVQGGERVQGGMVFLPEKKYPVNESRYSSDDKEKEARVRLSMELDLFAKGSCDLNPSGMGNTGFVRSDEWPLINDALTLVFNPGLTWVRDEGIEYLVVDYLKDHSLEEALLDPSLSAGLLDNIIRKKCEELNALLAIHVGKKEFREAYHDFLKRNLFEEKTLEEFSREILARFDVRLDTLIERWARANRLPVFEVAGRTITIGDDKLYDFKVFNRGEVPGVIRLSDDDPGWIIPPGEGRAIKTRLKPYTNSDVDVLLALNLPSQIELPNERGDADTDTTTWFLPLDSTSFSRDEGEIIVDNEDPGFKIVETRKFNLASLLGRVETRAKYYGFAPANHWGFTIARNYHGFPVKGAYFKKADKGNQKARWETRLPREGKYEVFCYLPYDKASAYSDMELYFLRTYHYTVFDGQEEHEVVLTLDKNDWGWISLGVFDFHGTARVTLSDRDREHDAANKKYGPQDVVADAMKWVKVQE